MGQRCALLWLLMQSHRGLSATRRYCPNGFYLYKVADTKTAAQRRHPSYRINILAVQR